MREIKVIALVVVCAVSLACSLLLLGCDGGQQSKSEESNPTSLATSDVAPVDESDLDAESFDSTDWKSYRILVNGKMFELPCMLPEFDKTGLKTKIFSPGHKQSSGTYMTGVRIYNSDPFSACLGTDFYADSEDPSPDEVEVRALIAGKPVDAEIDFDVAIPGNISWGKSTIDEAIAVYGEPDEEETVPDSVALKANYGITTFYTWRDTVEGKTNGNLNLGVDDENTIVYIRLSLPNSNVEA